MRTFCTTGLCVPERNYMADISEKLNQIYKMIDNGHYFTINRARQYGKTTALTALQRKLHNEYICVYISFEGLGDESFESSQVFCDAFMSLIQDELPHTSAAAEKGYVQAWHDPSVKEFRQLSRHISKMCENSKLVLMIDEVDKISNNRVFLNFLGMLRDKYLRRNSGKDKTFQSVILASVVDIKNIKLKMINEGVYPPSGQKGDIYNSPWNIAADFRVSMSLNSKEIRSMLSDYATDHHLGINIAALSEEIYGYTSGYPYMVSKICQLIDECLCRNWTAQGIQDAVKILLIEKSPLFNDMIKNMTSSPDVYKFMYELMITGDQKSYNIDVPEIDLGVMYGFIKNNDGKAVISNRVFEVRMTEYFSTTESGIRIKNGFNRVLKQDVISNGRFNMELCLRKFQEHYREIFSKNDEPFLERSGRLLFISYIRPLINGGGFYHIESQFTDLRRMDLVVDYGSEQFIIELKVWRGEMSHNDAYEQLSGYLEKKNRQIGYLLTFDFRKSNSGAYRAECKRQIDGVPN